MGNCLASCRPIKVTRGKVLQVVKTDGKMLEFSSPVLVKDVLVNFSGSGIGLSKEAAEHLPLDYELKLGQVYYILPSLRSVETISSAQTAGGVKRIKVVITKQQLKQLLTEQAMVVDQYDHYRPFPSYGLGGGDGPTRYNNSCISNDIYDVVFAGGGGAAANGGAADGLRTLQPFDISPAETITAFKSPGGIAATMGFPFTNAQWKELERQTMIYKYMMASVPVPPHLLFPTPRNLNSDPAARHSSLGTGLNLKFTNGADLEPGRCRRTDGKKWRCSRDVARDQKYCTNSQPYLQAPVFPDKPSEKVANFDASLAFAAAFKEDPEFGVDDKRRTC
ncbi:hypothetical protein GH714_032253 [Hevea brasiliensis]|uniref:Growth-regulating factor n=1 Tax=Hevea brasiliensis TaxID=3981 RepID=A0A6A6LHL2_HEVBR|nr:hypothetical protein GH714_032253 [Hevea brasiliensis]